jgi:hypothetical protein
VSVLPESVDFFTSWPFGGSQVREDKFLTVMSMHALHDIVRDPEAAEDAKRLRLAGADDRLYAGLRQRVQRVITGAKSDNVPVYAKYIADGILGRHGKGWSVPPITLWSEPALPVHKVDHGHGLVTHILSVPRGHIVIAVDGETQYIALCRLYEGYVDFGLTREQIREHRVAVEFYHGVPELDARQIFHDRNTKEVKPSSSVALGMDSRDPINRVVNYVANRCTVSPDDREDYALLDDFIEPTGRQANPKAGKWITLSALRTLVAGIVCGMPGISGPKVGVVDPDKMPQVDIEDMQREVLSICQMLFRRFAGAFQDPRPMIGRPALMGALGVVMNRTMPWYSGEHAITREALFELMMEIQWVEDERYWADIAGGVKKSGGVTSLGVRANPRLIINAIENPESPEGRKIRGRPVTA